MANGKIRVGDVIVDHSVLPRQESPIYTSQLTDALKTGAQFPLIRLDEGTKRIVSGLHRFRAHQKLYGDDHVLDVEFESYADDSEIYVAALKANVENAHPLSGFEKRVAVERLSHMGMDLQLISTIVQVAVEDLERRTIVGYQIEPHPTNEGEVVRMREPLKRGLSHLDGRDITSKQKEANRRFIGWKPTVLMRQLTMLIEADALDRSDRAGYVDAVHLQRALADWIATMADDAAAEVEGGDAATG